MKHSKVQLLLYEYLREELPPEDRSLVEDHLGSCQRCREELRSLKEVLGCLPPPERRPSDERPELYWEYFPDHVEERLRSAKGEKRSAIASWVDDLATLMFLRKRFVTAFSAALVVVALTVVIWRSYGPGNPTIIQEGTESPAYNEAQVEQVSDRMHQYFQKSKVLLIGLTNMSTAEEQPVNLTLERERSRELIQESRYLKYQGIDRRSARLIGDLEKILIELANMKEQSDVPGVEMIRTGIHRENLLFKIRMAEAMYDTARFTNAKYSY